VKQHMLFVDDEPRVLQGLRRMLHGMHAEWEMHFAGSGPEALALLEQVPCRVIVSDMRMPGMDGAELLGRVMERYPQMVRIALSGESQEESVLRAVGPVHQYLTKPCGAADLREAIARTVALQELVGNAAGHTALTKCGEFPTRPPVYERVLRNVSDAEECLTALTEAVLEDEAARRRILQLAQAVLPAAGQPDADPSQACRRLGLNLVAKALAAQHAFSQCTQVEGDASRCEAAWVRAVRVGLMAREICRCERARPVVLEDTLAGSLLHDVGSLVTDARDPLAIGGQEWAPPVIAGTALLARWAMPAVILEIAAYHRHPGRSGVPRFGSIVAVHVAHVLECAGTLPGGPTPPSGKVLIDEEYLDSIGVLDRLPFWIDRAAEVLTHCSLEYSEDHRRCA